MSYTEDFLMGGLQEDATPRELIPYTSTEWVTTIEEWGSEQPRIFRTPDTPEISEGNLHLVFEWPEGEKLFLQAEKVISVRVEKEVWTTYV